MEENKISLQHVQLPNDMVRNKKLSPNDLWVYINIRSFLNSKNGECFPSLKTLSERCDFSIPTIRLSIQLLKEEGWITIEKIGRMQKYHFRPYKNFEVFSYTFIHKADISAREKAYLISSQQYMFTDTQGFGKISYSDIELSEKINLPVVKIERYNQSLVDKGYLSLVRSDLKDEHGITINNKYFHLDDLGQAVVFTLQKHNADIEDHSGRLEKLEEQNEHLNQMDLKSSKNNEWLTKKIIKQDKEIERLTKLLRQQGIDKSTIEL